MSEAIDKAKRLKEVQCQADLDNLAADTRTKNADALNKELQAEFLKIELKLRLIEVAKLEGSNQ